MSVQEIVLLGMAGGLLPDVVRVVRERYAATVPAFLRSPKFYISLALGVLLGGFAAWLLQAGSAKDAVIYGFAAPELLTRLASSAAAGSEGTVFRGETPAAAEGPGSLREWWSR